MKTLLALLVVWSIGSPSSDTIHPADTLLVRQQIDFLYQRLAEESEVLADDDWGDGLDDEGRSEHIEALLEEYESLHDHPINLNSQEAVRLVEIGLLTPFQLESLKAYVRHYGDLLFISELTMVEGFDERSIAVLTPIVQCGKSDWQREQEAVTLKKAFTRGKHQLTLNYARKLEATDVYDAVSDSLLMDKPNAYYLGSPDKIQLKYSYRYGSKIRMGVAMEKDAGEPFLYRRLSDTIRQLIRECRTEGFDFYGAHLYMSDLKLVKSDLREASSDVLTIKDLVIGDYQLSVGQGLTLWSGMSFGKATGGSSVMRRGAGVRPKAAAGEGTFFRGGAATLSFHDFQATLFYSLRHLDATMTASGSDTIKTATALQVSGYHRSLAELAKRHTLRQQVFGGHLAYVGPQLEVGCTAYHLRLSAPLTPTPSTYNQFFFRGDQLTDVGLDFRWMSRKSAFFGELSMSGNNAFAGLVGISLRPAGYIDFTLMYRNYGMQYQNLFLGAVKESSRGQAEEGIYLGLQCSPAPRWGLLAQCDFFRLKWLTNQVYAPSWGQEYSLKVDHQISGSATMQLKFKTKTKMKNSTDDHSFSYYPVFYTKQSVQFLLSYTLFNDWVIGDKASYSHYFNEDGADSRGYFVCQDIAYRPDRKPWSLTFRYAMFSTDDYNSRISVYENDVLGAFSIPSFSGRGTRAYLLGKVKLFGCLSLYSRVGVTFSEETKTDFKVEVIWKQ